MRRFTDDRYVRRLASPPPDSGGVLRVLIIARISTVHQDRLQPGRPGRALPRSTSATATPARSVFVVVSGQGSGEILDRPRTWPGPRRRSSRAAIDLVVVEDLGRVCRRNRAVDFCEMCEDAGTRLIAINDSIDTGRDGWRLNAFFAELQARVRQQGHLPAHPPVAAQPLHQGRGRPDVPLRLRQAGDGAKADADVTKDPAAEAVYERGLRPARGRGALLRGRRLAQRRGRADRAVGEQRAVGRADGRPGRPQPDPQGRPGAQRAGQPAGEQDRPADGRSRPPPRSGWTATPRTWRSSRRTDTTG